MPAQQFVELQCKLVYPFWVFFDGLVTVFDLTVADKVAAEIVLLAKGTVKVGAKDENLTLQADISAKVKLESVLMTLALKSISSN